MELLNLHFSSYEICYCVMLRKALESNTCKNKKKKEGRRIKIYWDFSLFYQVSSC